MSGLKGNQLSPDVSGKQNCLCYFYKGEWVCLHQTPTSQPAGTWEIIMVSFYTQPLVDTWQLNSGHY